MVNEENVEDPAVLALVGPPAVGKSTVVDILVDLGVPCKDTGNAVREEAHSRYDGTDDPDEDYIWNVASLLREEYGDAGPTAITGEWIQQQVSDGESVVCISSLRDQAEVDWLRENVGPTLVIRIDADPHTRTERYVERELGDEVDRESVSKKRVFELREELYERERRESPYPEHDVTLVNEDGVKMHDVWNKLRNLIQVIEQ